MTELAGSIDKACLQFRDVDGTDGRNGTMMLELRIGGGGKGSQSVFPSSVHESGELIEWAVDGVAVVPSEAQQAWLLKIYRRLGGKTVTLHVIHRDIEGFGVLDLRKVGAHRWAADPRTGIYCMAFAVDDEPPQLWVPPNPVPPEFSEAETNTDWSVAAHNDPFESVVEREILHPRFGFPLIPPERHICTQAAALALGLPAKLGRLADALELANRKDAAGEKLMLQMARPRKRRKDETAEGPLYFDDPERRARLGKYCCQDVEVEREIYNVLRALLSSEHALWVLSSKINDRGFHVDRGFAEAARKIAQAAAPEIDAELAQITGGAVTGINQIAKLLKWLQAWGL